MRQTAALYQLSGNTTRAAALNAMASGVSGALLAELYVPESGFFGVYTTENDYITQIDFVARDVNPGAGGEGFGFDNAVVKVPEPTALILMAAGALAGIRRRR